VFSFKRAGKRLHRKRMLWGLLLFSLIVAVPGVSIELPVMTKKIKNTFPELEQAEQEFEEGRFKESLVIWKQVLTQAQDDQQKSEILLRVAVALEKDQEEQEAINCFLESLSLLDSPNYMITMSSEEEGIYKEGLEAYLEDHLQKKNNHQLYASYLPIVQKHPNYFQLNYLVAARAASLGLLDEFFIRFYQSYVQQPKSYLAYRSLGVLRLILWERTSLAERREQLRQEAIEFFEEALKVNPEDSSLYGLIVKMASNEKKPYYVKTYLTQMFEKKILMPRSDVYFLVEAAVESRDYLLAQNLIHFAKEHYSYSRAVNAAQAYLDQEKIK
jgi:tetratricopeptide (TPR) repeat protein